LGGIAAVVLFCGLGGAIAADYFWLNLVFGGAVDDLAMIPGDAQGFVTLRAADAWKLDATQRQWKQWPGQGEDPLQ
jgi:hypothetical protein